MRIEGRVEKVICRAKRCLLSQPPAGLAHRRLGQPAKRGDFKRAAVLVANAAKYGAQFLLQPAAPAALGRLPPGARPLGVLARPQKPACMTGCVTGRTLGCGSGNAWRLDVWRRWIALALNRCPAPIASRLAPTRQTCFVFVGDCLQANRAGQRASPHATNRRQAGSYPFRMAARNSRGRLGARLGWPRLATAER